jgi:hypothetical protein
MAQLRFLSKIEQVADYLREELASGKWHRPRAGVSDSTRLIPDPEIRRCRNWSRQIIRSDGECGQ